MNRKPDAAGVKRPATGMLANAVLVIEDELVARERVEQALAQAGFKPLFALDRREILEHVDAGYCAAIVLDLGLPADDGISIARAIRRSSTVPILMLTGRTGIQSRVTGLEAGADDYLIKPFAPEELIARLRAILRRVRPSEMRHAIRSVAVGAARVEVATRSLNGPAGATRLTIRELRLLLALCYSGGMLTRESIYREVFRRDWDPRDRSLDVHVAHLRQKLRDVGENVTTIVTLRGEGYELEGQVQVEYAAG